MIKSPNDHKTYQPLTLANGLRVLLIHNSQSTKSAAALAVNTGHFDDPKEREGLAHFLEHMLFLGTTKYPDGSEYHKFISQYGGSHNAWTATEHTCFFFDIHHQAFEPAIDRFSQFFISPLLSPEFVEKERKNIDAEFKLKLKDDIRRLYDVHKETVNQQHPFSQFSVGNIDTLADNANAGIRDEVAEFFQQHYHAGAMTLAIEGPQSLEQLEKLATDYFSDIAKSTAAKAPVDVPLYQPEHLALQLNVQPIKEECKLIVSFAMPSIDPFYLNKPESILSYLLGHEGKGSILSYLKQQRWAFALTAGSGVNGSNFKDFNISINLTAQGERHINDVISAIFSYIALIDAESLPVHFYQEKLAIADLSFRFQEKMQALDSVCQLVINMQHYPPEHYIYGDYVMQNMDREQLALLRSYLRPENMRIIHISGNNHFDQRSKWYQVPYSCKKIAAELIEQWQQSQTIPCLSLPKENPYIVADPKVYDDELICITPALLHQQDGYQLWFKQDNTFKTPKGHIFVGIDAPLVVKDTTYIAMSRLFIELFTDQVIEEHYDAELAGIHYHLYSHQGGMTLQLSGISERQPALLAKLITQLTSATFCAKRFDLLKHQLAIHWQNADKSKSISQLFSALGTSLQPNSPSSESLAKALQTVTFEQFTTFCRQLFEQITVYALMHGNWLTEQAKQVNDLILKAFAKQCSDLHEVNCSMIDIQGQGNIYFPMTLAEHDHASVIYFPLADREYQTIAATMLASQLLSPTFFQQMRTEKQYGYLVGVSYVPINRYPGLAFYVQSPHTDAIALTTAIDEFIDQAVEQLDSLSAEEWQQHQQGLMSQLQEKDTSLRIKSQRFWMSICNKDTTYDHKEKLVHAIEQLTLSDLLNYLKSRISSLAQPDRVTLLSLKDDNELSQLDLSAGKLMSSEQLLAVPRLKY